MGKSKKHISMPYFIDCLVIIMEISSYLTFIPSFTVYKLTNNILLGVFSFCIFFHLFRFGSNFKVFRAFLSHWILICLGLLYVFEILQHLNFHMVLLLFNVLTFISYLYNVYTEKKYDFSPMKRLLYPYIAFSFYNYIVICLLAILIFLGLPHHLNIIPNTDPLLGGHIEWDIICYFPYYLSVSQDYHAISLFNMPVLSGLSHEPNAIMYLTTPAVIFSMAFIANKKVKFLVIVVFVFVLLETLSTTAIIGIFIILIMEILWYMKGKISLIVVLGIILVGAAIYYLLNSDMGQMIVAQLEYKLVGEGMSSRETSTSMIEYLFNIKGLLGEGNFPSVYGQALGKNHSAGLVTASLDVIIYLYFTISSFKLVLSKEREIHYIGLGCLYYVLHGVKVSYLMVSYPYFIFIFMVMYLTKSYSLEEKYKTQLIKSRKFELWKRRRS